MTFIAETFKRQIWTIRETCLSYATRVYAIRAAPPVLQALHYLLELPKGKIYMHMEKRTDIFKAKKILGDHMCIQGNLKPSLFTFETPAIIEKQTKEMIDKCAEGGGLFVGAEISDNAKLENLKAVIDTCKTYGAYRK